MDLETTILKLVERKAELEANLAALMAQDKILFAQLGVLQVENSELKALLAEEHEANLALQNQVEALQAIIDEHETLPF